MIIKPRQGLGFRLLTSLLTYEEVNREKEYDSYIVYNGINVKAKKGSFVKAVFDGKILYAGELEGYGNLVIVGHGNKYILYMGISMI